MKNGNEACDKTDIGKTCQDLGFGGGTLSCSTSCTLLTGSCSTQGWATIPGGLFSMGSPTTEPCRDATDETQHQVTLTHGFEISPKETSQAEFQSVMSYNPASFNLCGSSCPVESVSWHEAATYCNKLSTSKGLALCYSCSGSGSSVACTEAPSYGGAAIYTCPGYRLPTDAEWEHAYRAGKTTALYNGTITGCVTADSNADVIAWYTGNAGSTPHPGGQKLANLWGLYDMAGNVYEWCHDWYQADLGTAQVSNPWGTATGAARVIRGGSYKNSPASVRAASRNSFNPASPHATIGFRCVRTRD